jgi:hypothetical protein
MSAAQPTSNEHTITYVVGYPGTGLVKIGQAKYYADRFEQLRNSSPIEPVPICAFVGGHVERELHDRFSDLRMRREFFQDVPELRLHLSAIAGRLSHEEALALSPLLPRRAVSKHRIVDEDV